MHAKMCFTGHPTWPILVKLLQLKLVPLGDDVAVLFAGLMPCQLSN